LLISAAILATAGYFAWKLAFPPPRPVPTPVPTRDEPALPPPPGPVTDTRAIAPAPPVPPEDDGVPSAKNVIEGTVRDDTGASVADAEVQIIRRQYSATSTRPPDRRFEDHVLATTVSAADGTYRFADLVPGEPKTLRALKPGFVTQMKFEVRVPKKLDFDLVRGSPVFGSVLDDATGKPIGGAGVKGWFKTPNLEKGARGYLWTEEVFTTPSGEFSFEGAPAEDVIFMIAHPDYVDVSETRPVSARSRNAFVFRMKPGLTIEGVVLHGTKGTPVPNLEVAGKDNLLIARFQARTGPDGVFRMKGVRPGPLLFEVAGRGYSPAREGIAVGPENDFAGGRAGRRLEIRIQPSGRAAGRVVTWKGEPVARARLFVATMQGIFVVVRDPAPHGGSMQDGETRTDEKGAFLVDDLIGVPHRIVVEAPGFALAATEPFSVGPDEIRDNVEIVLNPAPAIRGTVTDENLVPVAGAVITLELPQYADVWFPPGFDLGQKAQRTFITDETGRYRIEVPYAGKLQARVDHPEFVLLDGVEVAIKDLEGEVTRDFRLKQAFTISGRVLGPGGRGEGDAVVRGWKTPGGGEQPLQAKAAADGSYSLTRLEAGLYRLNATKPDARLTSAFRDEVPAGATGIDFSLVPTGEIVGAVATAGGVPVPEFQVVVRPVAERAGARGAERKGSVAGLSERNQEFRDAGGLFRIQNVDPGRWSLQAIPRDHAPSTPVELTVAGGAAASAGTIVVTAGGAVSGRIVEAAGAPAEGVAISLARVGEAAGQPGAGGPVVPQAPWTGGTGRTGEFAAKGLVPGEYLLRIESPRFVDPPPERIVVAEGATVERSYTLRPAASVTLSVKDEVGEPTPAVTVIVLDAKQRKVPVQTDGAGGGSTDRSGRVTLKKLPAGEPVVIRLFRPGFLVEEIPQTLKEGDNGVLDARIHRQPQ
jgi:hypothetical protein